MENHDEEIIVPETNQKAKTAVFERETRESVNKGAKHVLLILIIIALAITVVALLIILLTNRNNGTGESSNGDTYENAPTSAGTIYVTPTDSTDPEGDYMKWLDEQKTSAENSVDTLRATLNQASFQISLENYTEAKNILDSIDLSAHQSNTELFQYWNVYSRLYSPTALDDATLYEEYSARAISYRDAIDLEE
ncbi:hypothetical protein IJH29_02520 [Candidatus Saccharibacteria bacterium]|nr:hypothetical protein [Candidatus Saccharibacteria bacterium]